MKLTIARKLLTVEPELGLSVSATTRPMRTGEVDGRDYHFVTREQFDAMVEANEFYEWATVFGHSYGTPKAHIRAGLKEGHDYLFDIDWQGAQQLAQKALGDVVRVFILPPSLEELHRRLAARGTEISHWDGYDYVVVNEDVDACYQEVCQILAAERMKRVRQTGLIPFVRALLTPTA